MNHPGEIAQLAAMAQATVALVNNAQREHLEFMRTVDAVAAENGAVLAALAAGVVFYMKRSATAGEQALRASDVFKMPAELDGFSIVALLRRLRTSPLITLTEPQQTEIQQDLQRVQQTCFDTNSSTMSETDLRGVAEKWLRFAR